MLWYSKRNIPEFLKYSKTLIFGVAEDPFIREKILAYNYGEDRVNESVAAYNEAVQAESDKQKEFGEQLEASTIFEEIMDDAVSTFKEHTDFLKLSLKYDVEKQRKLFLIGVPRSARLSEYIKHMREVYDRVLADDDVVAGASKYGLTREALEAGRQKIIDAEDAKRKHQKEMGDAEAATERRDASFVKLSDIVDELETICIHAFKDTPQVLERLGIRVLSPGYKRKTKKTTEPQEEATETTETQETQETQQI